MRTKTLLLSAAALVAGLLSVQADTVYSQNIVGYYNLKLVAGYNMVANQLNAGSSNGFNEVFPALPDGTFVYTWNGAAYDINIFDTGGGSTTPQNSWYMSDYNTPTNQPLIKPGQGCFLQLPSAVTNATVGSVLLSNTVTLIAGYNMVGSEVPVGGVVNNGSFNLLPPDGTFVYTWNGSSYDINIYDTGGGSTTPTNSWYMSDYNTPTNAPQFSVGQGAFLQLPGGYSWQQVVTNN